MHNIPNIAMSEWVMHAACVNIVKPIHLKLQPHSHQFGTSCIMGSTCNECTWIIPTAVPYRHNVTSELAKLMSSLKP